MHYPARHVEQAGRQPSSALQRPLCMLQQPDIKQHHLVGCVGNCHRPAVWSEGNGCHRAAILHAQIHNQVDILANLKLARQ